MRRLFLAVGLSLLLLSVSCTSQRSVEMARTAQGLLAEGKGLEAAHYYEAAAHASPSDAHLRYNHLYALHAAGEYEQVLDSVDDAIERFPARLEFLRLKARTLSLMGRADEAAEVYRALLALNPGDTAYLALVMDEAVSNGMDTLAEEVALHLLWEPAYEKRALTVLDARSPGSWYGEALVYLTRQD